MQYVIGFVFHGPQVALIRKLKPEWQAGKLNGPGGKIEKNETPHAAMIREYLEETGVEIPSWSLKIIMDGPDWQAHVFSSEADQDTFERIQTTEKEEVVKCLVSDLPDDCIENLYWMIPLCRGNSTVKFPLWVTYGVNDEVSTHTR